MAKITVPIQVNLPEDWLEQVIERLRNDPEADWAEIIHCKDCKYYSHPWHCEAWNNSPGFPAVSDEMFCSLAERRTDEAR